MESVCQEIWEETDHNLKCQTATDLFLWWTIGINKKTVKALLYDFSAKIALPLEKKQKSMRHFMRHFMRHLVKHQLSFIFNRSSAENP